MRERFHPLGYPVEIVSGARVVLDIAAKLWGAWPRLFEAAPVQIEVKIHDGPAPLGPPAFRAPRGELRFCSDARNYAHFEEAGRRGSIAIAQSAANGPVFGHHFLEALTLSALDAIFFTPLHAACVSRGEVGTLLCGDSGAGKSSLAYGCARRGWTLVSDDAVHLAPGPKRMGVGASRVIRLREPGAAATAEQTIEVDAAAEGLRTRECARIGPCVFLRRRPGPAAWREIDKNAALDYFLKYLFPRDTACARRRLREFLDRPALELEYERMEDAADALEAL
ncbi:MAG TPA: hypothetical protein VKV74_04665 [Bryobacteraceae bacterium]|nr:hypothetical protein [Bryobacteraceae bacterium]